MKKEDEEKTNEIGIVFHGRGGQGAVKASQILALAASYEGKFVQAFPNFGIERQGVPLESYCRISNKKIYARNSIKNPDYAIIFDDTLLNIKKISAKHIIINSNKKQGDYFFDATKIALEVFGKNIVSTIILAVFCYYTKLTTEENLIKAVKEKFSGKTFKKNVIAIKKTFKILNNKKN